MDGGETTIDNKVQKTGNPLLKYQSSRGCIASRSIMSSSSSHCKICTIVVAKKKALNCSTCSNKFHKSCVNVKDKQIFDLIKPFPNIIFNCDNCRNTNTNLLPIIVALVAEVKDLKAKVLQLYPKDRAEIDSKIKKKISRPKKDKSGNNAIAIRVSPPPPISSIQESSTNLSLSADSGKKKTKKKKKKTKNNKNCIPVSFEQTAASTPPLPTIRTVVPASSSLTAGFEKCNNFASIATVATIDANALPSPLTGSAAAAAVADINKGVAVSDISDSMPEWINVRKKLNNECEVVIGQTENNELYVKINKKWVHLGSSKTDISENDIVAYIEKCTGIAKQQIDCRQQIKEETSLEKLKLVNFMLN